MPETIHTKIEQERKLALPKATDVKRFREYARGKQRVTLNNYQRLVLRGVLGNAFCDNVCKKILTEFRNRLKLSRFEVIGEADETADVLNYLKTDLWTKNKIPSLSSQVHWAMYRDGNTAVGLKWMNDKGRVGLKRESWWNGKYGLFIGYDDDGEMSYAIREWKDGSNQLRTIYLPDRIERYIASGNGWQQRQLEGDGGWPVKWLDDKDKPLGVPFVHFANLQVPNDGTGDYGIDEPDPRYGFSELDGGMIGLNDEINDIHRDMTAAARYAGYPMLKLFGITVKEGEDVSTKYQPEPGAAITDQNEKAVAEFLQPGSLVELERILKVKISAVSRNSGVPEHLITGNWPSGEAVMRTERPMEDKIETVASSTGPSWSSVAHKSTILSNVFGGTQFNEDAIIQAVFEPAFKRDPLTLAQVANTIAPYVSVQEVLRLLGKSPKEIETILTEMEDEAKRGIGVKQLNQQFNQPPGPAPTSNPGNDRGAGGNRNNN